VLGTPEEEAAYWEARRKSTPRCTCGSHRFFAEKCPECGALGGNTEECAQIFINAIGRMTPKQKRQARESLNASFKKQADERLLSTPGGPIVN
jgi:hypothetical protein